MIVSIHQPNYLPWTRLIHKIQHSDIFVVFDDVQLVRGKSFVLRSKIKTIGGPKWLTIPVKNKSAFLPINEIEINDDVNWRQKHCNSLISNYSKTEFFTEFYKPLENALINGTNNLFEFNLAIIKLILKSLKIKTKIIKSSEFRVKGTGFEKIFGILAAAGADIFLSGKGKGATRYTIGKEERYLKKGIKVIYQNFDDFSYLQQFGEFVPGLSIYDSIFNISAEKTLKHIL